MQCRELIEILEKLAPPDCACDWDNIGLLAGRSKKKIKRVLIALDADDIAIDHAIKWGADMLLTHHPLIFKPLKKINDADFITRRLIKLIQNDISYYAMHTNFDAAPGGMAAAAAEKLGLRELKVLDPQGTVFIKSQEGEAEIPYGIGMAGNLDSPMTVRELGKRVKDAFQLPFLSIYGEKVQDKPVQWIGISPGSGSSVIKPGLEAGIKVLITGDIGYHNGIDAAANGMTIMDAGHYGLEYLFMDFMEQYIKKETGEKLEICKVDVRFPATLI